MANYIVNEVNTKHSTLVEVYIERQNLTWRFDIGGYKDKGDSIELVDPEDWEHTELGDKSLVPTSHGSRTGEGIVVDIPRRFADRIRNTVKENLNEWSR